jgi:tetratricopeptide (TPR) repeat protein
MTRTRRLLIAGVGLTLALALFHGQLASAVVTRADDALRGGDIDAAMRLYDRAALIDPFSSTPADRLAFNLALRHDRSDAARAIAIASRAIARGVTDPALFVDRAFARVQFGAWRDAEHDFARAGALARDARYEQFAGRMALHAGDRGAAVRYARTALAYDAGFTPARALLRALR